MTSIWRCVPVRSGKRSWLTSSSPSRHDARTLAKSSAMSAAPLRVTRISSSILAEDPRPIRARSRAQSVDRLRRSGPTHGALVTDWQAYIADFHARRAGITERVLSASHSGSIDPYQWVTAPLASCSGVVLDLGCGSAPTTGRCENRRWVGLDLSAAELRLARLKECEAIVRGDAARLPIRRDAVAGILAAMSLMVISPLDQALREMRRVLGRDGLVVALLPAVGPLTLRDRARYVRLGFALRLLRAPFPTSMVVRRPTQTLRDAGFEIVADETDRFEYPISDERAGRALVESFYLPGVAPPSIDAATRIVSRWIGSGIGIPLRRVVAR